MTRETKIGMAVAVSFLCLVGVVIMTKWRRGNDDAKVLAQVGDAKDLASGSGVDNPPPKPAPKKNPLEPAQFQYQPIEANPPARLPGGNSEESSSSNPPVAPSPPIVAPPINANTPMLPAPPVPVAITPGLPALPNVGNPPAAASIESEDAKLNKLVQQIAKDKQQREASSALPPLPGNPFEKVDDAQNKAGNLIENSLNKGNELAKKGIDDFNRLPKSDGFFNKDSTGFNKGLDNANKQLSFPPSQTNSALPPLPANKENAVPMVTSLPALPPVENKAPAIPAPRDTGLPAITNTSVNNPTFVIPQSKPNDAIVVQYDIKSHVVRPGESFASLSRDHYRTDAYANALMAYNRDWSKDRNLTTLQPGQTILLPALQVLQQDRYARAVADARPAIGAAPVSINAPVPLNQNRTFTPSTPSADATKNYRIPVGGQKIYELAMQTMGDGSRWTEIYRLNPTIDPLQPIPGNTVVRLPAIANVP